MIDLTGWTEHKSDDLDCGKPPLGIELEFLQVIHFSRAVVRKEESGPWFWIKLPGNETSCTSYWRKRE
jgi:hypothetical protein